MTKGGIGINATWARTDVSAHMACHAFHHLADMLSIKTLAMHFVAVMIVYLSVAAHLQTGDCVLKVDHSPCLSSMHLLLVRLIWQRICRPDVT